MQLNRERLPPLRQNNCCRPFDKNIVVGSLKAVVSGVNRALKR